MARTIGMCSSHARSDCFLPPPRYLTKVLVGIGGADYLPSGLVSVPLALSLTPLTSSLT